MSKSEYKNTYQVSVLRYVAGVFHFYVVFFSQRNLTPSPIETTTAESLTTPTLTTAEAPRNSTPTQTTRMETPATERRTIKPTVSVQGHAETQTFLRRQKNNPARFL